MHHYKKPIWNTDSYDGAYVQHEHSKLSLCGFYQIYRDMFYIHSPSTRVRDTWISRFSIVMNMLDIDKKYI